MSDKKPKLELEMNKLYDIYIDNWERPLAGTSKNGPYFTLFVQYVGEEYILFLSDKAWEKIKPYAVAGNGWLQLKKERVSSNGNSFITYTAFPHNNGKEVPTDLNDVIKQARENVAQGKRLEVRSTEMVQKPMTRDVNKELQEGNAINCASRIIAVLVGGGHLEGTYTTIAQEIIKLSNAIIDARNGTPTPTEAQQIDIIERAVAEFGTKKSPAPKVKVVKKTEEEPPLPNESDYPDISKDEDVSDLASIPF